MRNYSNARAIVLHAKVRLGEEEKHPSETVHIATMDGDWLKGRGMYAK